MQRVVRFRCFIFPDERALRLIQRRSRAMRIEYTNSALHRWIAHVLLIVVAGGSAVSVGARDYAIWTFGNTPTTAAWTSHKTDDLSSWKSVDCMSFGPDFLVSGLIGYKEPWSNLDNFIARL